MSGFETEYADAFFGDLHNDLVRIAEALERIVLVLENGVVSAEVSQAGFREGTPWQIDDGVSKT